MYICLSRGVLCSPSTQCQHSSLDLLESSLLFPPLPLPFPAPSSLRFLVVETSIGSILIPSLHIYVCVCSFTCGQNRILCICFLSVFLIFLFR
ncbi:hypothetical protein J3Q64DRAFT_1718750 [Phycomyces blakesleeanus]|uniref:Uncharacterized protein n=1 Tax=Phycomyces blakesleeanus TaxID=4837 RepID=A0ABR3BB82_PHYBL